MNFFGKVVPKLRKIRDLHTCEFRLELNRNRPEEVYRFRSMKHDISIGSLYGSLSRNLMEKSEQLLKYGNMVVGNSEILFEVERNTDYSIGTDFIVII